MDFTLRHSNSEHFLLKNANIHQHNLKFGGNIFKRAWNWLKEKVGPIIDKARQVAQETGLDKVAKEALQKVAEKGIEVVKQKLTGSGSKSKKVMGSLRKRFGGGLAIIQ